MTSPVLIVGLGNPGPEYALTRHNVGFWAVDRFARRYRIRVGKEKGFYFSAGTGSVEGWPVILAKPHTYMNLSGKAVRALLAAKGVGPEDLVVFHDDMDIALGKVKLKTSGGDAGHKGIRSIIQSIGTGEFRRLRIGLGRPPGDVDGAEWVLSPFQENELEFAEEGIERAAERAAELVSRRVG